MSRKCDITGKAGLVGYKVSHSNRHTKRRQLANVQDRSLLSAILGHVVSLRLSSRGIRTIDKHGGVDQYMLTVKNRRVMEDFSDNARTIHTAILKRAAATGQLPERKPRAAKAAAAR